ncbi:MAG: ATP-binding protein, partial [Lachnospiraceae bacterium]|nr:ATP-binding protein [Lachnospiraceae bacterium]
LDTGHSVLYYSAISLFDLFSESLSRSIEKTAENPLFSLYEADLVIIDDLGTELKNSFTTSQLFHLINERLLSKKSTIISTNLSLNALGDQYTERTASRILSDYEPILLTGADLRIKMKLEREAL